MLSAFGKKDIKLEDLMLFVEPEREERPPSEAEMKADAFAMAKAFGVGVKV